MVIRFAAFAIRAILPLLHVRPKSLLSLDLTRSIMDMGRYYQSRMIGEIMYRKPKIIYI